MMVVCHVGDLKASQKDRFEVTKFAQYLSKIYWNKLKVHRGKIYYCPGIYLDYSETGMIKVSIIKYLQNVLEKFPEELRGIFGHPGVRTSVPSKR